MCSTVGLSKACDTLNHKPLIAKLEAYGLDSETSSFLQSYLTAPQENIGEDNFYFPKYSISVSQSSADTIRQLELTKKITSYFISQGYATPGLIISDCLSN